MTHPVLTDADLSVAIVLGHEDGTETETRGMVGWQPEADALDTQSGMGSGWNATVPTPESASRVETLNVERTAGIVHDIFQVLYAERTAGALYSLLPSFDSTRYQIVHLESAAPAMVDFDPADFSSADFG